MTRDTRTPPCVHCGAKNAPIGISTEAAPMPIRMCFACYLLTPAGVRMVQQQVNDSTGDIEDGVHPE